MNRRFVVVSVVAIAGCVALLAAAPAHACEAPPPHTARVVAPFEGQTVPRNASLQMKRADNGLVGLLVDDTGSERRLTWRSSALESVTPPFADDGLQPGPQTLTLHYETEPEGVRPDPADPGRTMRFTVVDRVDDDAVVARVVRSEETLSGPPDDFETPCDGEVTWPRQRVTWRVEVDGDDDLIGLFFRNRFERLDAGIVQTFDDTSWQDGDIVGIDFAGNRSTLTIVDDAPGCASVPAASMSALALSLLVRRRRS